jgi:hypothetical protein
VIIKPVPKTTSTTVANTRHDKTYYLTPILITTKLIRKLSPSNFATANSSRLIRSIILGSVIDTDRLPDGPVEPLFCAMFQLFQLVPLPALGPIHREIMSTLFLSASHQLTVRSVSLLLRRSSVVVTPLRRRPLGCRWGPPSLVRPRSGRRSVSGVALLLGGRAPTLVALHHVGTHRSAEVHRRSAHLTVGTLHHAHGRLGRTPSRRRIRATHLVTAGAVARLCLLDLHLRTVVTPSQIYNIEFHGFDDSPVCR